MSLLDVGKNLFNSGKKAATDFLTQYPTPASYIQAKTQPQLQQGFNTVGQNIGNAIRGPISPIPNQGFQKITQPIQQFGGNLVQDYIQRLPSKIGSVINMSPPAQIGSMVNQAFNPLSPKRYAQQQVGQLGNAGSLALDVATLPFGGGVVKNIAGQLGKQGLKTAIVQGAKEGAKFGSVYGGLESLFTSKDEKDLRQYAANITTSSLGGGLIGGAAGGVLGGAGYSIGKVFGTIVDKLKIDFPKKTNKELVEDARGFIHNELGQFAGKRSKQKEPIYYGDLRESLGLPREGFTQKGEIDFSAKIGKPTRNQNSKVPLMEQIKPSTKPIQQPITNKPLSTNALPKSIPLTSKSTPQQVAASLPSRVDDFVQKTLGYSTKDPTGGTRKASLWTRTLRKGEEAITSSVEKGLSSENALVRNAASTLQNFFRGAGMSTERSQASMGLRGEMAVGTERAYNVMESLYKSLGNDKKSLERINAVLDPDISKVKISFNQLSETEKQVYGIIREGLDIVHDTSYANGNITPEMYKANRGKYTPRMYEAMELPPEVNKFISQGKKIVNDLYKKRGEVTDWKTENSLNDPVYALGKRLAQVETNNAVKKYVGYLASNPQFVSNVEKAGFVKLSDSPAYGQLKGKYVLNSAAEDLKGFFFANEGLDKLYDVFRIYDRLPIRQLQKKLLTVFNPTTNVGNIVSDQIFGFVTGVDPFTLNRNLLRLKNNPSEFKQLTDYLMLKGIVGTDITKTDFVNRMGQIDSLASGTKKGVFARISDKVTSFYGGTDDAYKVTALKSLLEKGFSLEEATRKVADGFQNYSNVGKFYDVWSKTPVVGSTFIKFQGDLMRIIKNGAVNNPLGLITFLGTLAGVARLSSKLSGETDSDRVARENRFAAPMIPGLNIPLTWQTPMGEINVARYISPFFANNDVTNLSKMLPFVPNIDPKKDVATNIALNANDPLTATAVQLAVNRDFRGKNIADPKENKYQPSTLTPQERLKNQAIFAGRGYTPPPINSAIDVYSASQGKENMYGAKQSVPQALARMAGIKIQKYGPEEVAKAKETNDKFQESKNEAIDRQINAVYKQQLKNELSPDQVKNRVNYLESQKVDSTGKSGTKEDIFRYLDAKGNMQSIDMNFQPTPPEKTGLEELDKKALSKFYGEITSKANDIYTLYKEGKLTEDEANTQLSELKTLKAKYSSGKKAPKITVKKVKIPKIKIVKSKPMKVTNFSIKAPSMPKAKKSTAIKIKKIKPIKLAKLTIKSKNV